MVVPSALVLGCNTPHGIGVLSDWIEEQTGQAPDFTTTNWSDCNVYDISYVNGDGYCYGDGCGNGYGYGSVYGYGNGNGSGDGYDYGDSNGNNYTGRLL